MVDHLNVSYLYKKRGVFYFSKRVPCDVKSYYKSDRQAHTFILFSPFMGERKENKCV